MGDQLMVKFVEATLAAQYSYRDKFHSAYVGRAARALIRMARTARPAFALIS
jgi:hypothetical protein